MEKNSRITVFGSTGLVGTSLCDELKKQGYTDISTPSHSRVDLLDAESVEGYFESRKPEYCFLCAAKVGGIYANDKYSADFIYENTLMQTNAIKACHDYKVRKLLFLGSSCIYPRDAEVPIKEEALLSSNLESTNIGYAVAKINGIVMCQLFRKQYGDSFICAMPTNLFGKKDSYHPENSHVFPALIKKIHDAKIKKEESIILWGSGRPKREFLFSEDLAEALVFLMNSYDCSDIINIGTGLDISILDLARLMCKIIGYEGEIIFDISKPDGTIRKVMDVSKINKLGWEAKTKLEDGIRKTYQYFLEENK